jgi:tripartite-type tricarboxylate transporter receptor subunit TctC
MKLASLVSPALGLAVALCVLAGGSAWAQPFPSKPIRIIIPYAPAGLLDTTIRNVAQEMSTSMGQSVIVENRPGASTFIGMSACSNAAPDGYTVCATVPDSLTYNPLLFKKIPYDPVNGFTPISNLAFAGGMIVAGSNAPFSTFPQMIAYAKARPGALNWGTWGPGSIPHIYLEWLKQQFGVQITGVPYRGAGATMPALLANEIHMSYVGVGLAAEPIKSGRLKAIVMARSERLPTMPEVPAQSEFGGDPDLNIYFGVFGPPNMPPAVVDRLSAEFAKAIKTPKVQEFFRIQYLIPVGNTAGEFRDYMSKARDIAEKQFKAFGIAPVDAPN